MEHCMQCGFVYTDMPASALPEHLAAFGSRYQERLWPADRVAAWPEVLRQRPTAAVWSALEYACHVRDVFLVQRDRLYVILVEDTPVMTPMYRNDRVTLARYNEQAPGEVIAHLAMAAQLIAQAFAALDAGQCERTCRYNFPTPAVRSLLWVGQHVVHEGEHHLQDIAQVLAQVGHTHRIL